MLFHEDNAINIEVGIIEKATRLKPGNSAANLRFYKI